MNPVAELDADGVVVISDDNGPRLKMSLEDFDAIRAYEKCTWCGEKAAAKGADGTYSCGSGQGDGKEHHVNIGVQYTPLHGGIGFERIR